MTSDRPKKFDCAAESDRPQPVVLKRIPVEIIEFLLDKAFELLVRLGEEGNLGIFDSDGNVIDDISPELDKSIEEKAPQLVVEMFATVLSQINLTENAFEQILSEMHQIHVHTDGKNALYIKVVPKHEISAKSYARKLIRQKLSN